MTFLSVFLVVMLVLAGIVGTFWLFTVMIDGFDYDGLSSVKAWGVIALFGAVIAGGIVYINHEESKPFDGYVYKKAYYPPSTMYVMSGKIMVPVTTPARWNVVLKDNNGDSRSCDVSEESFEQIQLGQYEHCGGY